MFERFTAGARAVVVGAQGEAHEQGAAAVGTEHTLLALLTNDDAVAGMLRDSGVDAPFVRAEVRRRMGEPVTPDLSFTDADAEDAAALKAIGIDLSAVRAAIEANFGTPLHLPRPAKKKRGIFGRRQSTGEGRRRPLSNRNKKVLELSLREALRLHNNFIAPEHIMLGILREGNGLAALILTDKGVDFDQLRTELTRSLKGKAA